MRGGADVTLRIRGIDGSYKATAIEDNPEEIRKWLIYYLGLYPQDASYHDIAFNSDKTLVEADLDRASRSAIVVEAQPMQG